LVPSKLQVPYSTAHCVQAEAGAVVVVPVAGVVVVGVVLAAGVAELVGVVVLVAGFAAEEGAEFVVVLVAAPALLVVTAAPVPCATDASTPAAVVVEISAPVSAPDPPPPQAASRTAAHAQESADIEKRWTDKVFMVGVPFRKVGPIILIGKLSSEHYPSEMVPQKNDTWRKFFLASLADAVNLEYAIRNTCEQLKGRVMEKSKRAGAMAGPFDHAKA